MTTAHTVESSPVADRSTSGPSLHPLLAWAGIVGPILFTLVFWAQEAVRRAEYDPLGETVSALEAGPHGWVQQVNFIVFGTLTVGQAIGLHLGIRPSRGGLAGPALLGVSGVGLLLAAALPLREDAAGTTYDQGGHVVAGITFFCSSALALIVLSRRMRRDPRWQNLSDYTLAAGIVALLGFIAMGALVMPDTAPLHAWAGTAQRLLILLVLFPCRVVLGVRSLPDRTLRRR